MRTALAFSQQSISGSDGRPQCEYRRTNMRALRIEDAVAAGTGITEVET
jgi:hypothetical protein